MRKAFPPPSVTSVKITEGTSEKGSSLSKL